MAKACYIMLSNEREKKEAFTVHSILSEQLMHVRIVTCDIWAWNQSSLQYSGLQPPPLIASLCLK